MKEMQPNFIIEAGRLTTPPVVHTLDVRGDIFMPDGPGNGEIGQRPEDVNTASGIEKPQAGSHEQNRKGASLKVTPEKIEQARRDWEKYNEGRTLSVGEKGTQEKLIEIGVSPMPGASDTDPNIPDQPAVPVEKSPTEQFGITEEAKNLIRDAKDGIPASRSENLKRILRENGISEEDIQSKKPQELIDMLEAKNKVAAGDAEGEKDRDRILSPKLIQDADLRKNLEDAIESLGKRPSKEKIRSAINFFSSYKAGDSRIETINELIKNSIKEGKPKTLEQILEEHKDLNLTIEEISRLEAERQEIERQRDLIIRSLREEIRNAPENEEFEDEDTEGVGESHRGQLRKWTDAIDSKSTKEEKIAEIRRVLSFLSPQSQIPVEIIQRVIQFDETTDYLVNRIIAQPLDQETSHYQLSFYGSINLDQIKDKLKSYSESSGHGSEFLERYQEVLNIAQAVSLFHEMNREIITGNMEGFVNGSRGITPDQLQSLQEVNGVSSIMRIMEGEFMRIASRDGYINDKNFEEIMGSKGVKSGKNPTPVRIGSVERMFRNQIEAGLREKMDEWEVKWAFNSSKLLYNLSLRAAEQISLGKIQEGDRRYASIPQESAAKLMNWLGWTGLRFEISPQRGGMKLVRMAQENYQNERKDFGYGDISLEKIGGRDVAEYETAGMFGATGAFSSWRQNLIILEQMGVNINGFSGSLREYINAAGNIKSPEAFESHFLVNGTLRPDINSALGVILKNGTLAPSHRDSQAMRMAKEKVRRAIWEEVALNNPLAIAPILNSIQERGAKKSITMDPIVWGSLTEKLNTIHEIRMQSIRSGKSKSLDQITGEQAGLEKGIKLTTDEKALLDGLRLVGSKFAKDIANIRFPFNPFMNDVIFEEIHYGEAGSQFYSRRMGGDLPSFYNSYNEFVKLMDNPGGTSIEDSLKVLHAMVQAIGQPQGIEFAQDRVFPFLCAYLRFIEMGGQSQGAVRFFEKFLAFDGIKKLLRSPNSYAQQYSGMQADALNELAMSGLLDNILDQGITRKGRNDENGWWIDLDEKLRKKFGLKLGGMLLALFRDFSQIFAASLVADLGSKATNDNPSG